MLERIAFILLLFLLFLQSSFGQQPPKPYGALPTERQLMWQQTEMYCIIHFSMATFADKEWGFGDDAVSVFNPDSFNALQIVGAAKAGGFKAVVIVAKHHDGFCLWPTKTTEYNISNSPWKNGKGDIVKEYEQACQKLGMKLGLYCSPWDRNNALYGKPAYVTEVYRKQLEELYSHYGPLFMSWHDGANGGTGYYGGTKELREIDRTTYYGWDSTFAITRRMQPMANIFTDIGPDVRWVGNEDGKAGETSWETYTPHGREPGVAPANGLSKYWEGENGTRNGDYWMPAECDVPLRPGWFYHQSEDGQSKNPYKILDLYYESVGRGACLDLGLSPNKHGLITSEDVNKLKQFKTLLDQIFSINLAKGATFKASNIRGDNVSKYGTQFLLDDDRYSYWATDDEIKNASLEIELPKQTTFNVIRLRENIKLGQRIDSIGLDVYTNGVWKEAAQATSIGANRLIRLSKNISCKRLRLRIYAPVCIALSDFGLFKEPVHLTAPIISRNRNGYINIATDAPVGSIHYTTDGSEPTLSSPAYQEPFLMPQPVVITATSFDGKAQSTDANRKFDYSKMNWQILSTDTNKYKKQNNAIDEDAGTVYSSIIKDTTAPFHPETFIVDMGSTNRITALTYLPRQDKKIEGIVDQYIFYTSVDGTQWRQVAKGEFANIRSNPIEQIIKLEHPVSARYFKFEAIHVIAGNSVTMAEIGCR